MSFKKVRVHRYFSNIYNMFSLVRRHHRCGQPCQAFIKNELPATLSDKCVSSFLDKSFSSASKISIASKFLIYFSLPYTGSHGLQIRTLLIKLLSSILNGNIGSMALI